MLLPDSCHDEHCQVPRDHDGEQLAHGAGIRGAAFGCPRVQRGHDHDVPGLHVRRDVRGAPAVRRRRIPVSTGLLS